MQNVDKPGARSGSLPVLGFVEQPCRGLGAGMGVGGVHRGGEVPVFAVRPVLAVDPSRWLLAQESQSPQQGSTPGDTWLGLHGLPAAPCWSSA